MKGQRIHWLWWLLVAILLAGAIGFAISHKKNEDYIDGTLVWNATDTLCMGQRHYCHLFTICKPIIKEENEVEVCQKSSI